MCAGYYAYEAGYLPDFPGLERFQGRVVHPQKWTEDIEYAGKRVLVIGSGATAVTLVPELAKRAAHVVMLQRSPTYVVERPSTDAVADALRATLPQRPAYRLARWKNILLGAYFFRFCRRSPQSAKWLLLRRVRDALGPDYDVAQAFHAALQPVGAAAVPRSRRRSVPGDPQRTRLGRHRSHRSLHEKRRRVERRRGDRGRSGGHRDRPRSAAARRRSTERRRRRSRSREDDDLQRRHVQRRPQSRVGVRLHQRLLDAEGRFDLPIRLPPAEPYGRAGLSPVHAAQ